MTGTLPNSSPCSPLTVYFQHAARKILLKFKSDDITFLLKYPPWSKLKILKISYKALHNLSTQDLWSHLWVPYSPSPGSLTLHPWFQPCWPSCPSSNMTRTLWTKGICTSYSFYLTCFSPHIHITRSFTSFRSFAKGTFSGKPPYQKWQQQLPPDIIYLLSLLCFFSVFFTFFNT